MFSYFHGGKPSVEPRTEGQSPTSPCRHSIASTHTHTLRQHIDINKLPHAITGLLWNLCGFINRSFLPFTSGRFKPCNKYETSLVITEASLGVLSNLITDTDTHYTFHLTIKLFFDTQSCPMCLTEPSESFLHKVPWIMMTLYVLIFIFIFFFNFGSCPTRYFWRWRNL